MPGDPVLDAPVGDVEVDDDTDGEAVLDADAEGVLEVVEDGVGDVVGFGGIGAHGGFGGCEVSVGCVEEVDEALDDGVPLDVGLDGLDEELDALDGLDDAVELERDDGAELTEVGVCQDGGAL